MRYPPPCLSVSMQISECTTNFNKGVLLHQDHGHIAPQALHLATCHDLLWAWSWTCWCMINGGSCVHVLGVWSSTASSNQGGILQVGSLECMETRWPLNNWSHIDTHGTCISSWHKQKAVECFNLRWCNMGYTYLWSMWFGQKQANSWEVLIVCDHDKLQCSCRVTLSLT